MLAGPPGIEPGTPGFPRSALSLKVRCSVLTELRAHLNCVLRSRVDGKVFFSVSFECCAIKPEAKPSLKEIKAEL